MARRRKRRDRDDIFTASQSSGIQSMLTRMAFALIAVLLLARARSADAVWLGRFDGTQASIPSPWRVVLLDKQVAATEYRVRLWDDVQAIEANASNSMALLVRPADVDLNSTPILCWRWRIDSVVQAADMQRKSGDDYAARVYVTFALPPSSMSWTTRIALRAARRVYGDAVPDAALNYVWDNKHSIGTSLPNAYTNRTRMIVVQSGNADAGRWVWQRRDVAQDFAEHFDSLDGTITSIAIASDTDNTHAQAHAGFADLHFVSPDQKCETP